MCSNYTNILHCALVIMCAFSCDVSGKHEVMHSSNLFLLSFSCLGYDLLLTPHDEQEYITKIEYFNGKVNSSAHFWCQHKNLF